MNFSVDLKCEMKVNRNCELCYLKVTEIMNCLTAVYSVNFVGENNTVKVEARGNPHLIMATIQKYGDHGKITNLYMDGESITPHPGGAFYGQSGYYLPSNVNAPAYHPFPPPHFLPGNFGYPMPNPAPRPPRQTETPREVKISHHTAPPSCAMQPPPPMPLSSYSYIEPPYWPASSSGGNCTIM